MPNFFVENVFFTLEARWEKGRTVGELILRRKDGKSFPRATLYNYIGITVECNRLFREMRSIIAKATGVELYKHYHLFCGSLKVNQSKWWRFREDVYYAEEICFFFLTPVIFEGAKEKIIMCPFLSSNMKKKIVAKYFTYKEGVD